MSQYIHPIKFAPCYKETIWGGEQIAALKGISLPSSSVGESWEVSGIDGFITKVAEGAHSGCDLSTLVAKYREALVGERCYREFGDKFPILIKFIDAKQDLSIQVHPNDTMARVLHDASGKCEMWYVISATADAAIYAGLSCEVSPQEVEARIADNSILDVIAKYDSKPGDVFYLPAGRVHSIGAGNLILEVQQASDITYRLYDFDRRDTNGNKRELHIDKAKQAIDYTVQDDYRTLPMKVSDCEWVLAKEFCFEVRKLCVKGTAMLDLTTCESFLILTAVDGEAMVSIDGGDFVEIGKGETVMLPANASAAQFKGDAEIITVRL